jgi:hypothetical protein
VSGSCSATVSLDPSMGLAQRQVGEEYFVRLYVHNISAKDEFTLSDSKISLIDCGHLQSTRIPCAVAGLGVYLCRIFSAIRYLTRVSGRTVPTLRCPGEQERQEWRVGPLFSASIVYT